MIYVENEKTYPDTITRKIQNNVNVFKKYFNFQPTTDADIRSSLEVYHIYHDEEFKKIFSFCKKELEKYDFVGFHNTRIYDMNNFIENGIEILSQENICDNISLILNENGIDQKTIRDIRSCITAFLHRGTGKREGLIGFYAPLSIKDEYAKFTKNCCGEVADYALENKYPEEYHLLRVVGKPKTIEFIFSLKDIVTGEENLIMEIIRNILAGYMFNIKYEVIVDGSLGKPIAKKNILQILDYIDETGFDD